MKVLKVIIFLIALVFSAGASDNNETIPINIVTKKYVAEEFNVRYSSQHDIVKIDVPFNQLNKDDLGKYFTYEVIFFFIEGDKENDTIDYKGLYKFRTIKDQVTKIMDNARDVTSEIGENKNVFIAASDGLYIYNVQNEAPEKYGTVTNNLIKINKPNNTDIIYALNDKYELLNITEKGTKVTKVDSVKNARQIVTDFKHNIFFVNSDNSVFVLTTDGVKEINGLPEEKKYVELMKPLIGMPEGVLVLVNDETYRIFPNCTSSFTRQKFDIRPTTSEPTPISVQFYGYDKKIYEYNTYATYYRDSFKRFRF